MKTTSLILSCALLFSLGGCSTAAWYESVQQSALRACDQQTTGARADCLARVNKQSQSSYEKDRHAQ